MPNRNKTLMRSLGEFVGHIWHGVTTNPRKKTIRKTVEEEDRDGVTLRRTTIEEIEIRRPTRDDARDGQD
jgi:hypothetical protein